MTTNSIKPNSWFWVIGIVALLWNLMGVSAYLMEAYNLIPIPEEHQPYYDARPAWVTAGYAIAVFGGILGCILLLMRRKLSKTVFIISLLGLLAQQTYNFFLSDIVELMGIQAVIFPIIVLIIAIFLIWYADSCTKKGLLR